MKGLLAAAAAWLGLVGSASAAEERFADYPAAIEAARSGEASPYQRIWSPKLIVSAHHGMRLTYDSVSFHPVWWPAHGDTPRTAGYVARRRLLVGHTVIRTSYADDRRCRAIEDLLRLSTTLEPPRPHFHARSGRTSFDTREPTSPNFLLHGTTYQLKGEGVFTSNDTRAEIQISGDDLTPLAVYVRVVFAALEPCWSDEAPLTR